MKDPTLFNLICSNCETVGIAFHKDLIPESVIVCINCGCSRGTLGSLREATLVEQQKAKTLETNRAT